MKNNTILLLGLGLGAALIYMHLRNVWNRLAYKIVGIQLVNVGREEIKLNINLLINNPTNIRAQVGDFIAKVYINSQYVGNINYPINRYINPGVNDFTVGVVLKQKEIGNILWQQLQSGNLYNMDMDIDGSFDIDDKKLSVKLHFILQDFWDYTKITV